MNPIRPDRPKPPAERSQPRPRFVSWAMLFAVLLIGAGLALLAGGQGSSSNVATRRTKGLADVAGALPRVLDTLQANGYRFVAVSDILFR